MTLDEESAQQPGRWSWVNLNLRTLLGPALLVLVAFLAVGLHVKAYVKVSPIDEMVHIDTLYKAPTVIGEGEIINQQTMHEEACRGLDYPDWVLPPCADNVVYQPEDFPGSGYNTTSINTPLYYSATKAVAVLIGFLTGGDNLVNNGRLAGGIWLALGLLVAYAAGRRLHIGRLQLTAALLLVPAIEPVLLLASTITPDAMTMLVGALVIWTVIFWEERPRTRWWLLAIVTIFALAVKQTNILIIGVAGVYVLIRWLARIRGSANKTKNLDVLKPNKPALVSAKLVQDAGNANEELEPRRTVPGGKMPRYWLALLMLGLAAGFVLVGWSEVAASAKISDSPSAHDFDSQMFPLSGFIDSLGQYLVPLKVAGPGVGQPELISLVMRFTNALWIGGLIAASLAPWVDARVRALATALLSGAVLGAASLVLMGYLVQGTYFTLPDRYGYSLIPGFALCLAYLVRARAIVWSLAGISVTALALAGIRLLGVLG